MDKQPKISKPVAVHGNAQLRAVEVNSYNIEIRDDEGFIGDRASKGAFRAVLEAYRETARNRGTDPFGDIQSDEITKEQLDEILHSRGYDGGGYLAWRY